MLAHANKANHASTERMLHCSPPVTCCKAATRAAAPRLVLALPPFAFSRIRTAYAPAAGGGAVAAAGVRSEWGSSMAAAEKLKLRKLNFEPEAAQ